MKILEILQEGNIVSGEEMAGRIGLSRVAVWKHINKLEESGYQIEASSSGYKLVSESDIPIPESFGSEGKHIEYVLKTASTMDKARDAAFQGCAAETVFIAGRQTAGRGRNNRSWISEEGGLYFTFVDRPDLHPRFAALAALKAALVLCSILKENYSVPAVFKWPNDIYVNGRKIAGILAEYFVRGSKISFANIGIGINVHNQPQLDEAESLDRICRQKISRSKLLKSLLHSYFSETEYRGITAALNNYSLLRNKKIKARTASGNIVSGLAGDICPDGHLAFKSKTITDSLSDINNEIIHIEGIQ